MGLTFEKQNLKAANKVNAQLIDELFSRKAKNIFYKRELLLCLLMSNSVILLLFYLNNWGNKIIFFSITIVLSVVAIKFFSILNERISSYARFIAEINKEQESNKWAKFNNKNYAEGVLSSLKTRDYENYLPIIKMFVKLSKKGRHEEMDRYLNIIDEAMKDANVSSNFIHINDMSLKEYIEMVPSKKSNDESAGVEEKTRTFYLDNDESNTSDDDTFGSPIEELLEERKLERKKKLLLFNKKFQKSYEDIDKIEIESRNKHEDKIDFKHSHAKVSRDKIDDTEFIMLLSWLVLDYRITLTAKQKSLSFHTYLTNQRKDSQFKKLNSHHKDLFDTLIEAISYSEKIIHK